MTPDEVGGIVRNLVAAFGGALVLHGYADNATLTAGAGAIGVLASLGWSIWSKRKAKAAAAK